LCAKGHWTDLAENEMTICCIFVLMQVVFVHIFIVALFSNSAIEVFTVVSTSKAEVADFTNFVNQLIINTTWSCTLFIVIRDMGQGSSLRK